MPACGAPGQGAHSPTRQIPLTGSLAGAGSRAICKHALASSCVDARQAFHPSREPNSNRVTLSPVLGRATRYTMRQVENFRFVVINGLSTLGEDEVHRWRHIHRRQFLQFHPGASDAMMDKAPGFWERFWSFLLKIRADYSILEPKTHAIS